MAKRDDSKADKKSRKEANKSSNARAAQEKFVLKVGAFGVLLAVVVGFYLIFSSNMSKDVPLLEKEEELKEALLSGSSYLLQCTNDTTPIYAVTAGAASILSGTNVKVAAINCHKQMGQSGKNFFQRFNHQKTEKLMMKPMLFTVSNGNAPVLVSGEYFKTAQKLADYAKARTTMRVMPLFSTEDMDNYCLKKRGRTCIVFAGANVNNNMPKMYPWLTNTLKANRLVKFVSLNTKKYKIKARPLNMRPIKGDESRAPGVFVLTRPVKGKKEEKKDDDEEEKKKKDDDVVMGKQLDVEGELTEAHFNEFLSKAVANELELQELEARPVIRQRPAKSTRPNHKHIPEEKEKQPELTPEQRKAMQLEREKRGRERMEREEKEYAEKVMGEAVEEDDASFEPADDDDDDDDAAEGSAGQERAESKDEEEYEEVVEVED